MIKADAATVSWDPDKKAWRVRIQVGEEIIKRPCDRKVKQDADDERLRTLAVQTAHDDGYEVDPGQITIAR
jgi:hypothetical protein